MDTNFKKIFEKSPLFREMRIEFLEALATIAVFKQVGRNELLFTQGDLATGFYLICRGRVRVFRMGNDGREQVLHLLNPGETLGEVAVFQGTAYPACAAAVGKAELAFFPLNKFIELGKQQPELLLNMLGILSQRLRKFVELIDDLTLKDVATRLAKFILLNAERQGRHRIKLESSKSQLASELGTIPATLSRTLKRLQDSELIEVDKSHIEILDAEGLTDVSEGGKLP
jgi:CRP-like cAMP-binding protein